MLPFLFFLSLVGLIVGLIKPSLFSWLFREQPSRKKVLLYFGLAALIFVILGAATQKPTSTNQVNQQEKVSPVKQHVFDVPSLVEKNIDEVRSILGNPEDKEIEPSQQQLSLGVSEWNNTFRKDGKELLITYNPKTRKVIDFFISTDNPSGKTTDKNHLLDLGNIEEGNSNYRIEFVKAVKDPSHFTGIKIIPVSN